MRLTLFATVLLLPVSGLMSQEPPSAATRRLRERNTMFKPEIVTVAPGVYTAIGYQVSTNTMIVGTDGVIVIDPGQMVPAAARVRAEFEKISGKPVKAIIYTHAHFDHTGGARAFFEGGKGIEVWARANFGSEERMVAAAGLGGGARPANTQGFDLLPEQRMGIGVAIPPANRPAGNMMRDGLRQGEAGPPPQAAGPAVGTVKPTHTFSEERRAITVAGVRLEMVAAPGETGDALYVWLPDRKVVFAGDNFYQSWPNVYPLRGSARRSLRDWISSVNKMAAEGPMHLVGGHTRPMLGNAGEVLANYRDAMQWVLDRTIEGARKFMTPDELVEYAALPERFAKFDYLADYYGSVEGTVRDLYAQDLGWFDGDPLNLHRETPKKQSERIAALAGGVVGLREKARAALREDPLGAAQFAQHLLRLVPGDRGAMRILADALAVIGERTFNAPARNYTLSMSNRYRRMAEGK